MNALLTKGNTRNSWTGGFWKDRWDLCRDKMIPHMWEILNDKEVSHCWENFRIAAGLADGEHVDPPFWDGDLFKWLEAACRVYGDSDDRDWRDLIDFIIDTIAQVQRDDGYIFTYDAIQKRNNKSYGDLENDNKFEVYNMGHLISAGVVHYRTTGKTNLLDLGKKAAAYLASRFSDLDEATPRTAICPSHYMGLADLYQVTGDDQYLDLLEKIILLRDRVSDGTDDNQDRYPLKEHREILGHGVRATYLYAGLTDLYMGKGDEEYREVIESVWNDMVTKKMYITGGCAPLYDGVSPYGGWNHNEIQRTHQSFGRAYELPNTAGYNETCAAIGSYLWNYRNFKAFGESKYADYMERALYNSIISGINLDGDKYFYTNALRCVHDLPYDLKWSRHRESFISSFCCPPNVVRTIAETQDMAALVWKDGIAVLMYGDSRISAELENGSTVNVKVNTDYPWSGEIELLLEEVNAEDAFPIYLRIPEWANSFEITVNDERAPLESPQKDGFIEVRRKWKSGDQVLLSLPMDVIANESHPMVEEARNHLALSRGPIVYCVEAADLPRGLSVADIYIDPKTEFVFENSAIGSTDLGVLKGELWVRAAKSWSDRQLYRNYNMPEFEKIETRLIPYFAWDNREQGEMSVWLPILPAG